MSTKTLDNCIDDFDEYPILEVKYLKKDPVGSGESKWGYDSGVLGDGLCAIWSVLNGWGLLGRPNFTLKAT